MTEKNHLRKMTIYFIIVYLVFCIFVLIATSVIMSRLISRNVRIQTNNILSLMSEKVNTSFAMMTNYAAEAAELISAQKDFSFKDSYDELQTTIKDMPYNSIGLVSSDGTVYGTPGEKMDIEKHNFVDFLADNDDLYITEPYRSSVTGSNMITMFAPISHNGMRIGDLFVTYHLSAIQNLAATDILSDKTSVVLMNPYSGNYVTCTYVGNNPPGTWSNIRLIKNDIRPLNGYDYDTWLEHMRRNDKNNIVNFNYDNTAYTQAYVSIDGMDNWNIVIRIPLAELSDTMQHFTFGITISATILVLATLLLALVIYLKEHRRSETLQTLSDVDALTKVLNRRAFDTRMEDIFSNKAQLERSTFMFFDVDLFKIVNDTYGHDAGDQVLYKTANLLNATFADTGIVARIGGDEFNVFIYKPLTVADIDSTLAELRMKMKEMALDDGTEIPVSFSAGLAVYPHDASDLKDLKECADKALYHVKQNGRNNHFWYDKL